MITHLGSDLPICDPPVSVYKGYSMPKDTEKYLLSCGLKNAVYYIRAFDLTQDLFGTLVHCPPQVTKRNEMDCPGEEVIWIDKGKTFVLSLVFGEMNVGSFWYHVFC
ncbi:uncharacterized protein [Primulina eburnea]|uniref:uncharacterized protein isoform X1 n=1 Tax=Primulina eburnea TaxID=1245227 RepID=UPI003C6BDFCA